MTDRWEEVKNEKERVNKHRRRRGEAIAKVFDRCREKKKTTDSTEQERGRERELKQVRTNKVKPRK